MKKRWGAGVTITILIYLEFSREPGEAVRQTGGDVFSGSQNVEGPHMNDVVKPRETNYCNERDDDVSLGHDGPRVENARRVRQIAILL